MLKHRCNDSTTTFEEPPASCRSMKTSFAEETPSNPMAKLPDVPIKKFICDLKTSLSGSFFYAMISSNENLKPIQ